MSIRLADELERRKNALTVRELALLLSLSEKLIYRLIRQGVLSALRVGTSVRLDPSVTANWIRGRVTVRRECISVWRKRVSNSEDAQ
jgi:excisionase family DNA binding protein